MVTTMISRLLVVNGFLLIALAGRAGPTDEPKGNRQAQERRSERRADREAADGNVDPVRDLEGQIRLLLREEERLQREIRSLEEKIGEARNPVPIRRAAVQPPGCQAPCRGGRWFQGGRQGSGPGWQGGGRSGGCRMNCPPCDGVMRCRCLNCPQRGECFPGNEGVAPSPPGRLPGRRENVPSPSPAMPRGGG